MICSRCRKEVPDESTFCLSCGARLGPSHAGHANGGGPPAVPAAAVVPAPPGPGSTPTGKQAYALSFRPIADERLRYRVARWICDHAPAHGLTEVQEGLRRGDFFTFLALTSDEVGAARQGIEGLGVAPAQVTLSPATAADMLRPERMAAGTRKTRAIRQKDLVTILIVVVALFVFGLAVVRLFGGRGF